MPPQPQPMSRTRAPGRTRSLAAIRRFLASWAWSSVMLGMLEVGAGVLHVAVEEEAVEPLVEVVVVGDVGARRLEADGAQERARR